MLKISVIIPVLNDASELESLLTALQDWRRRGHELVVVDGGSNDAGVELAAGLVDVIEVAERGRARQMNRGARLASGQVLLFLHVDTRLPLHADQLIVDHLNEPGATWGRFDVKLSGRHWLFRIIEWCMNLRSQVTGVATGDQALFVRRETFEKVGQFPDIALMEDVAVCKNLRRLTRSVRIRDHVVTSSRRWETRGIGRTITLMWWLRFLYFCGVSPESLAKKYYG